MRFIKLFFIGLAFSFVLNHAKGQITFYIDTLKMIDYYREVTKMQYFTSDDWKGPTIVAKGVIVNHTDSALVFDPASATARFLFRYDNKDYVSEHFTFFDSYLSIGDVEPYLLELNEKPLPEPIEVQPNDTIKLEYSKYILIFTGLDVEFDKKMQYDYREEMLMILPTLKVQYEDKNRVITTCDIRNVKLINCEIDMNE